MLPWGLSLSSFLLLRLVVDEWTFGFKVSPLEAESEPESEPEPEGCEDVCLLRWRAPEGSVLLDIFFFFRFSVFGFRFFFSSDPPLSNLVLYINVPG